MVGLTSADKKLSNPLDALPAVIKQIIQNNYPLLSRTDPAQAIALYNKAIAEGKIIPPPKPSSVTQAITGSVARFTGGVIGPIKKSMSPEHGNQSLGEQAESAAVNDFTPLKNVRQS